MTAIEDRHIVFLRHVVDGVEERKEVLLCIDILLTVSREQNVLPLLQSQTLVNIACLNLG